MAKGELVTTVVPNKHAQPTKIGSAISIARQVIGVQEYLPEDANAAAQYSRGLWSRQNFPACNAQEFLLGREIVRIENRIYDDKFQGRCPQELDNVDVMLGNAELSLPGDDLLKHALFEVVVAALRRENVIYMPFHETDTVELYIVGKLIERAEEVVPMSRRDEVLPLPKFDVRFVGKEQPR